MKNGKQALHKQNRKIFGIIPSRKWLDLILESALMVKSAFFVAGLAAQKARWRLARIPCRRDIG